MDNMSVANLTLNTTGYLATATIRATAQTKVLLLELRRPTTKANVDPDLFIVAEHIHPWGTPMIHHQHLLTPKQLREQIHGKR